MLKQFLSLILVLVIGGSVLGGAVRPSNVHVCKMAGMGIMPGAETMNHDMERMDHGMAMMPSVEVPKASPSLSHSHEMMTGMEMSPASPPLSQSQTMSGLEMMPGMETMPCCRKHGAQSVSSQSGSEGECCVNLPQENGSSGIMFTLRLPSFNVAVIHPAILLPPITAPKPYECFYSTEVFLPNLQASYLRNLSFLI